MGRLRTSTASSRTVPAMYRATLPKPGQWSVTAMSLSMVLGMPMTEMPLPLQAAASLPQASMVPLPPFMST